MQLLSTLPTADAYLTHLQQDLEGAQLLRFVIAYVSESGIASIGQDLLLNALKQPNSFGVASLSCSCGFEPLVGLQKRLSGDEEKLKYFVDPVVLDSAGDPELALVHSKVVYIVTADGRAVVYLGSHNWSGRALGPNAPRNTEASMRFEFEFDSAQLDGQGADLPSEINRHLIDTFKLGASLPINDQNVPIFTDWYRARCERDKPLPLDEYAVVIGACVTDGVASTYDHLWKAILTPGVSIYLPCHVEAEGQILRQRQDRVLLMAWTSKEALEDSKEPVLLFCKVTRQVAGKGSAFEGTSEGDIENFDLVLRDPTQSTRVSAGDPPGEPLSLPLHNGQVFEYFELSSVPPTVTASTIDGKAAPKYQNYLQVYQVLLPEWLKQTTDPRAVHARTQITTHPELGTWSAANLALTSNRQIQPEVSKNYRVPEETRKQIIDCFMEYFGLSEEEMRVRPVDPNVAPKELVRLAQSRLHYGYINDEALSAGEGFYKHVRPGRLAADLGPMQKGPQDKEVIIEARVQKLYAERLREILENVGIKNPDLTAWEAKPPKRKSRSVNSMRLKLYELADEAELAVVINTLKQRHEEGALKDFALLKELLLLSISVHDAKLNVGIESTLFRWVYDKVRTSATGFFSELFVQRFESIELKYCKSGWPGQQSQQSSLRREVIQFLKSQALGDDQLWLLLSLEYLKGIRIG